MYRKWPPRIVNRTVPKIIMISVHTVNRFPLTYMYIKHYLLIVIEFFSELKVSCGLSNNNQLLINSILLLSTQPKLSLQYKIINLSNIKKLSQYRYWLSFSDIGRVYDFVIPIITYMHFIEITPNLHV